MNSIAYTQVALHCGYYIILEHCDWAQLMVIIIKRAITPDIYRDIHITSLYCTIVYSGTRPDTCILHHVVNKEITPLLCAMLLISHIYLGSY